VVDGDIITVSTEVVDNGALRHDDPVDAVAVHAASQPTVDGEHWRRWTALGGGSVLLLAGATALACGPSDGVTAVFPAVLAAGLFAALVLASRTGRPAPVVTALAYGCCLFSAAAGLRWSGHPSPDDVALARAGGAVLLAVAASAAVVARRRLALLPAAALGSTSLVAGVASRALGVAVPSLLTCLLTLVVLGSLALPRGALAATRTGRHRAVVDPSVPWAPLDLTRAARDVEVAREVMVAGAAATGLVFVVLTPVVVSLRPFGLCVTGVGGVLLVLWSRHFRATVDVVILAVSGVLGLVATAVSVLSFETSWRLAGGVVVALVGFLAVAESMRDEAGGLRRSRLCHIFETVALGTLLPALVLAVASSLLAS
jgi:hypothetical protein